MFWISRIAPRNASRHRAKGRTVKDRTTRSLAGEVASVVANAPIDSTFGLCISPYIK